MEYSSFVRGILEAGTLTESLPQRAHCLAHKHIIENKYINGIERREDGRKRRQQQGIRIVIWGRILKVGKCLRNVKSVPSH